MLVADLGDGTGSGGGCLWLLVANLGNATGSGGGCLRLLVADLGNASSGGSWGLGLLITDLGNASRGSRGRSLGLLIIDLGDAGGSSASRSLRLLVVDRRDASAGWGSGLRVRRLGDGGSGAAGASGATGVNSLKEDIGALRSSVLVIQVAEAAREARAEKCGTTESERVVGAHRESGSVLGTWLWVGVIVGKLELGVRSDVANVAILVLYDTALESVALGHGTLKIC